MNDWTRDKTKAKLQWAIMVDELIEEAAEAKAIKMCKKYEQENELLRNLLIELQTILRAR
jgi:hypothetical protein